MSNSATRHHTVDVHDEKDGHSGSHAYDHAHSSKDFTYDMVMVFRRGSPDETVKVHGVSMTQRQLFASETARIVQCLRDAKVNVSLYQGTNDSYNYCLLGCTEARLQQEADRTDYELELDRKACLEHGVRLGVRLAQLTRSQDERTADITETTWDNLFGKYDRLEKENPWRQELYKRYNNQGSMHRNTLFRSSDRIKLTVSIIEAERLVGGAGLRLVRAQGESDHPLAAFFALHEKNKRDALKEQWAHWMAVLNPPLNDIRDYFGEQVGFYFAFLNFYNVWLTVPAMLGLIVFIWQLAIGRVDVVGVPVFGVLAALWGTLLLEFWKRQQSRYESRWGMTHFAATEQPRPEFEGNWEPSPINGQLVEVFSWNKKVVRSALSQSVVFTLIGVVIAFVAGIFLFRTYMVQHFGQNGGYAAGVLTTVQIQVLNFIYSTVAVKLNDYENHRTDSEYENSLIAKTFLFKFVNSYNTLFYIAFIKKYDHGAGGCGDKGCIAQLQQQLGTIFVTTLLVDNAVELLTPIIKRWLAAREDANHVNSSDVMPISSTSKGTGTYGSMDDESGVSLLKENDTADDSGPPAVERTPAELQYELSPYDSTFEDFDELIVQYGFVILFVVAFPITPFLALINNAFETKLDAYKLLHVLRRPEPKGAANIGTWFDILDIVGYIAVVTNVGLVVFETTLMDKWTHNDINKKWLIFFITEHSIFLVKFAIAYFVPDIPQAVGIHRSRQEFIVDVLINGVEEEGDNVDVELEKLNQATKLDRQDTVASLDGDVPSIPVTLSAEERAHLLE